MSEQHPTTWRASDNRQAQYPTPESWLGCSGGPPYVQDITTDEDCLAMHYSDSSSTSVYRYHESGMLAEAENMNASTGSGQRLPQRYNHDVEARVAASSHTTGSAHTPETVPHAVALQPNAYNSADYSDTHPSMHHSLVMRDGRSYRQCIRYQEHNYPLDLLSRDSFSSSSSMEVGAGSATEDEMRDQMRAEDQNISTEHGQIGGERKVATESFAADDWHQPTPSMVIDAYDRAVGNT